MENQLTNFIRLLKPISSADAEIIDSHFEEKDFNEGEFLFNAGKICKELFFICSGVVRIVSVNDKGIELTHYFYSENQFCTILQSFNDEIPSIAGIQASCDVTVMEISKKRLHDLYRQLPYMKELIDELNQLRLIEKVNIRNTYLGQDAENRYKLFIMQHPDIALRVPVKDIASYLGITPQSLSRIRKKIG